jgi:hypothetical protein
MALTLIWYFLRTLIERFTQEVRLGYIGRLGTGIRTWASLLQSKVIVGRIYKLGVCNCGMGTKTSRAAGAIVKAVGVYQGARFGCAIHDDERFIAPDAENIVSNF